MCVCVGSICSYHKGEPVGERFVGLSDSRGYFDALSVN